MAVLHRRALEQLARQYPEGKGKARREAEIKRGEAEEARLRVQVEDELRAERQAAEARAALTPEQRSEARIRQLERPLHEILTPWPARPIGYMLMREKIQREWQQAELDKREAAANLPARRAAYDKRHTEIEDA